MELFFAMFDFFFGPFFQNIVLSGGPLFQIIVRWGGPPPQNIAIKRKVGPSPPKSKGHMINVNDVDDDDGVQRAGVGS